MRILFVYPNSMSEGFIQLNIAILSAVLKEAGHTTSLFDTTFFETSIKTERVMKEKALEFKKVKNFDKFVLKRKKVDIKEEFRKKLREFKPDLIAVSCVSSEFNFLLSFLGVKKEFDVPTIVGGAHATVAPEEAIAPDCIDIICIGEGERALLELCEKMEKRKDITKIKNLWVKKNGKIYKNNLGYLIEDLDSLPYPDWSIFNEKHLLKPFWGKIYRFGYFIFNRGCPFNCSFCINSHLHQLYRGKGRFHREKSINNIINEIKYFKSKYNINFIQFTDETFLTLDDEKFEEFAKAYRREIKLPFYMMTRPETITERKARALKETGCCKLVGIGVESGNEKIRKIVCNKSFSNKQLLKAAKILHSNGIGITSYNMIGLPNETREQIFDTIRINKKIKSKPCIVYFFYPFKGTPLRELCEKEKYMKEDNKEARPTVDTILEMPQIKKEELRGLKRIFPLYLRTPEFLWPIIRICEGNSKLSKAMYEVIGSIISFKFNYLERGIKV